MNSAPRVVRLLGSLCVLLFMFLSGFPPFSLSEAGQEEQSPGFEIIHLQHKGVAVTAESADVNGDGETDLLLFHKPDKEAYEKICTVYLQKNGKFSTDPDAEIHLDGKIGAIDIDDIDGDGADELCGFDDIGMVVFKLRAGLLVENSRVLNCRTLLPPSSRRIAVVNWIADIDADGRSDIVLPVAYGLHVFVKRKDAGFAEAATFKFPVSGSVSGGNGQSYITYRLPAIQFSDFDGDGHTDIGAFDIERIEFFLTGGEKMPGRRVTSHLIKEFTKDFISATDYRDLNADGLPDAVLALMSQKKNLESEVRIYFCDADFSYGEQPAHVYSGETNLILPMFLDATGDGKMEMLLQNINVGFGFFLNYFLANRIKVDTELYELTPEGKYAKEPVATRAIYVNASATGTEPAHGVGDFNGDGLDDIVVGTREDRLSFFLSDREAVLPGRPAFEIGVPAHGTMKTLDLNADDRTDIVIIYPQEDNGGTFTLLLSN